MFTWLRQKMADTYQENVKRNLKAAEHPMIVHKLIVLMEVLNTLQRNPLYRPGETFFDIDFTVFNKEHIH